MPVVLAGEYVPEVCKTLETRRLFLAQYLPKSRPLKPMRGMQPTVELRMAKDTTNRAWFFAHELHEQDMIYLMHLNPHRLKFKAGVNAPEGFGRFSMYQGSVWRSSQSLEQKLGLYVPSDLFWKLSPKRIWLSDTVQSKDGKRFWQRRIAEALTEKGLRVYALHFIDTGFTLSVDTVVPILAGDSLEPYFTYEVLKDDSGMNWRFAIIN